MADNDNLQDIAASMPKETTSNFDNVDLALARKLKLLRQQAGKTQSDIAQILDISPQQYQKYEKGNSRCAIATVYQLANYYKLPITALLPASPGENIPGFEEEEIGYSAQNNNGPIDEATAMAQLLAILIKLPTKEAKQKLLLMLGDII